MSKAAGRQPAASALVIGETNTHARLGVILFLVVTAAPLFGVTGRRRLGG